MHDFLVFRTVSGPYDVPLDDPNPRFGQQRRKKSAPPLLPRPIPLWFHPRFKGNFQRSSKRDDGRGAGAAAAGAATPDALLVRAPERDHVHRRGRLYIPLSVRPPIPRRHSRRDLVSSSARRLGEAEAWLQRIGGPHTKLGQDTGPRQVWSHREASLTRGLHALCPSPCASVPISSHIPLQCARAGLLLGASVGALTAELALRHRCVRYRPAGAVARAEGLSWPQIG